MTGASAVGGRLLLSYLPPRLHPRAPARRQGRRHDIPLPASAPPAALAANGGTVRPFFSYTSITTPTEIHRFDLSTGKTMLFKRPKTAFNPDEFETRRRVHHQQGRHPRARLHRRTQGFGTR